MSAPASSSWLTVIDVSDVLEVPISQVYALIEAGRLCGQAVGRTTMVARADLDAFIGSPATPA